MSTALPLDKIPTPCYVIDEARLERNGQRANEIRQRTGCDIILALKSFACYKSFPILKPYISGTTASSVYEAKLGYEEFGTLVHVYAPAYTQEEIDALLPISESIIFNSISQWNRFSAYVQEKAPNIKCGIRVNPELSLVQHAIYNPSFPQSRLGIPFKELNGQHFEGLRILHFHNLCGSTEKELRKTLQIIEEKFSHLLEQVECVNFGGGHLISSDVYDRETLIQIINEFQSKHDVKIIMEPGEGLIHKAAYLVAEVLDITRNEVEIAVINASASAHAPDVLEMPYRPVIQSENLEGEYVFKIGGNTCMAGDSFGTYRFKEPLKVGDKLVFEDMGQYTMVKNTMFNGIPLPSIGQVSKNGEFVLYKSFGYSDYKNRLS